MASAVYRKSGQVSEPNSNDMEVQPRQPEPLRLTDQYVALLVLILTKAGLLEVGYYRSHFCMFIYVIAGVDQHVSRDNDRLESVKERNPPNGRGSATCE
jgi:hypothetical protein